MFGSAALPLEPLMYENAKLAFVLRTSELAGGLIIAEA
jgi:hypothetical protein